VAKLGFFCQIGPVHVEKFKNSFSGRNFNFLVYMIYMKKMYLDEFYKKAHDGISAYLVSMLRYKA
jgi:hypothetical protein